MVLSPKLEKVSFHTTYPINLWKKTRINLLLVTKDVEVEDTSCEGEIDETYYPEQDYEIDETYDTDAEQQYPEQTIEPIKETKYHYCWNKNLNRLLCDQIKHKGKTYFCDPVCMASQKMTYSSNTKKTVMALIEIQHK